MNLPFNVFRADHEVFRQAVNQPETGMGYQQVEIFPHYYNQVSRTLYLANATYLWEFENFNNLPLFLSIENLLQIPSYLGSIDHISIMTNSRYSVSPTATLPPYTYYSKPGDVFIRLSAFNNDKRILSDGSVLAGTYGTTLTDMTVTPSGLAAVGRYALPNRLSAFYRYRIIPPVGTPILFGTVTPNYGLCGGGVEVFFPNGCPKGSAFLFDEIPDK
jgi:hypothetical protein